MGDLEQDAEGTTATLHVEGVASPIFTTVTRRGELGMTVEQALPFLRLHTRVQDGAERDSRIESVSMVVYDGMPRLVLDLSYAEQAEGFEGSEAQPARRPHAGIARPRRVDETVPFEVQHLEDELLSVPAAVPVPRDQGRAVTQSMLEAPPPVQLEVSTQEAESERDDSTLMFRTVPPSQMTLEERLLHAHTISYRARMFWDDVSPRVQHGAWTAWRLGRAAGQRAWPLCVSVATHVKVAADWSFSKGRAGGLRLRQWRRDRRERKLALADAASRAKPDEPEQTQLPQQG